MDGDRAEGARIIVSKAGEASQMSSRKPRSGYPGPIVQLVRWVPDDSYVNLATASARVCARGTSESTTRYSSGVCALPPTGPTAQMVGVPTAAVKPESAQPPVNSPSTLRPTSLAQPA